MSRIILGVGLDDVWVCLRARKFLIIDVIDLCVKGMTSFKSVTKNITGLQQHLTLMDD